MSFALVMKFLAPLLVGVGGKVIDAINKKHGVPPKDDPSKPAIDAKKHQELKDFITGVMQMAAGLGWIPAVPADSPEIAGAVEMFYRLFKLGAPQIPAGTPADPTVIVPSAGSFSFNIAVTPIGKR